MEPVRLGVIGCGVMGNSHLKNAAALPEHYRIVAVADLRRQRAAEALDVSLCEEPRGTGR